ncbi:MAG: hypothetical protein AMXMBFR64_07300 [Myxococcales bacterium]
MSDGLRHGARALLMITVALGAGCDAGSSGGDCTPLAVQCSDDGTAVVQCNGSGTGTSVLAACEAPETCMPVGTKAECRDPAAVCTPKERACSSDGQAIVECKTGGYGTFEVEPCGSATCAVVDGAPACVGGSVEPACTPGARTCADGATVIECKADGSGTFVVETCAPAATCQALGDSAECVTGSSECTPGEKTCAPDGASIIECKSDGTGTTMAACPGGQTCVVKAGAPVCGAPEAPVCVAGRKTCSTDGKQVLQCKEDGSGTTAAQSCAAGETCVEAGGTATCEPDAAQVCTPGATSCSTDGKQVLLCKEDGSGTTTAQSCGASETCVEAGGAATCEPQAAQVCTPGATSCSTDGKQVLECKGDGSGTTVKTSCATTELCVVTDGAASCQLDPATQVCTPGTTSCSPDAKQVLQCKGDGTGTTVKSTCTAIQLCVEVDGAASCQTDPTTQQCTPDAKSCSLDSTQVLQCKADGTGSIVQSTCAASTVCIATGDSASCEAPTVCIPGAKSCSPDGKQVLQCKTDGTGTFAQATCTAIQLCVEAGGTASCELDPATQVCVPGETSCSGDAKQVLQCKGDGTGTTVKSTCTAIQLCVVTDGVASCQLDPATQQCTPGAKSCSADAKQVLVCKSDGTGSTVQSTCSTSMICVESGGGASCQVPKVCTPGTRTCSADSKQVLECKSDGTGNFTKTTCTSVQLCVEADGTATCETDPSKIICTPNTKLCSADLKQVLQCNTLGTATTLSLGCTASQKCVEEGGTASCQLDPSTQVCTPNVKSCSADGKQVLTCKADGTGTTVSSTCSASTQCVESGGTASCQVPKVCTPNERVCSADGKQVLQCKADGTGTFVFATCSAVQVCLAADGTASCQADPAIICTANKKWCSADKGEIRLCDATGKGFSLVEACTGGAQCTTDNVSFWCACTPKTAKGCHQGNVVWLDSCGTPTLDVTCNAAAPCVDSGPTPVCGTCAPAVSTKCGTDDLGQQAIVSVNACNVVDGVVSTCTPGLVCVDKGAGPTCVSSVADPESPYYTKACTFSQFIDNPTSLIADCRCLTNRALTGGLPICWRPYEAFLGGNAFGTGPRVATQPSAKIYGGFVDAGAGALVAAVAWSSGATPDAGFVFSMDLATGDRALVSGQYLDPVNGLMEVGAGHTLKNVVDVQRGPDGNLYVWSGTNLMGEIVRVDPATGARTLVWQRDGAGFAFCDNGRDGKSVQTRADGFALDADGSFLIGFSNTSPVGEGLGVIRISGTGAQQTCSYVTRSGTMSGNAWFGSPMGGGWAFTSGALNGFGLHDGKLLALNAFDLSLYAIDLATGDRSRVTSASTTAPLGAGPTGSSGIGQRWVRWDSHRQMYWTVGREGGTQVVLVDPTTGNRTPISCNDAPGVPGLACISGSLDSGLSQGYGGFWFDPEDPDLVTFSHDGYGVVLLEVSTGNSVIHSL